MTNGKSPKILLLEEFATWLAQHRESDLVNQDPERAVELFVEAREFEYTFLVDGDGYWWLFHPAKQAWFCTISPSSDLEEAAEEVGHSLSLPGGSIHKGFDEGAAMVLENFGIAS